MLEHITFLMEEKKANTTGTFWDNKTARSLRLSDMARLSFRSLRTRPTRVLLTVLGMSIGVGIVMVLTSLGYGLQYLLIGRIVMTEDSLITLSAYFPPDSVAIISREEARNISSMPGVGEVSPVAEFPAELRISGAGSAPGYLLARIVESNYERLSGTVPDVKAENPDPKGVIVSASALKILGQEGDALGRKVDISVLYPAEDGLKGEVVPVQAESALPIIGIMTDESLPPFVIFRVDELPGDRTPPYFESILAKADKVESVESIRGALIEKGFLVSSRIDMVNQVRKIMSIVTVILGVFGITALVVSAIGMFNTMLVSFLERVFEVGIMKAVGATNKDIRNLFLAESFLMGILGGLGGLLIGAAISEGANFGMNALARSFGGKAITLFIRPWWFIALVMGISSLIGLLAGFWPARRATRVSPREAFIRK